MPLRSNNVELVDGLNVYDVNDVAIVRHVEDGYHSAGDRVCRCHLRVGVRLQAPSSRATGCCDWLASRTQDE